ncbi:MAG: tetratricopeptide repeat protein [Candidatus Acidiferrales bacterium]
MRDKYTLNFPTRAFLIVGLLYCTYLAARQGIAAWYFRKGTPQAIQTAIKWDPGNPQYYDALATLTHMYATGGNPNEVVRLCEKATELSPYNAFYWADLAAAYEWVGRKNDALRAFARASALFPNSPEINWKIANFYVRIGKISDALPALREVLLEDPSKERQVFSLATNATGDNQQILQEMLPRSAPMLLDYLDFKVENNRMEFAAETWATLLKLDSPFDPARTFPYLDALIQHKDVDHLTEAWGALASRFPRQISARESKPNLITNGNFNFAPLNGGLDWRIIPVQGATATMDASTAFDGSKSLRIDFDGTQNLEYAHVLQYVPVTPDTSYKFSAYMRAQGITTDSGLRFVLQDAYDPAELVDVSGKAANPTRFSISTENVTGTSDWSPHQLEFRTPGNTRLLIVRVARPSSRKFDNKLAGTIWIARVTLSPK